MQRQKLLNSILEDKSSEIMDAFDSLLTDKISSILEDRRRGIAASLLEDGRGREDGDEQDDDELDDELSNDDIEDESGDDFNPFDIDGGE